MSADAAASPRRWRRHRRLGSPSPSGTRGSPSARRTLRQSLASLGDLPARQDGLCSQLWFAVALAASSVLVFLAVPTVLVGLYAPCDRVSCLDEKKMLAMLMKQEVQPCDDFYEFVCGGLDRPGSIGHSLTHHIGLGYKTMLKAFLAAKIPATNQTAKQKLGALFISCIRASELKLEQADSLKVFLRDRALAFPEPQATSLNDVKRLLVDLSFNWGLSLPVSLVVYRNLTDGRRPAFYLSVEDYWQGWRTDVRAMNASRTLTGYLQFMCEVMGTPGSSYSRVINDILEAHVRAKRVAKGHPPARRPVVTRLKDAAFRQALNQHLPKEAKISSNDTYYQLEPAFELLAKMERDAPGTLRRFRLLVAAYILWIFAPATSPSLHKALLDALGRTNSQTNDALLSCGRHLDWIMPNALWRMTADVLWTEDADQYLGDVLNNTKNAFRDVVSKTALKNSPWARPVIRQSWRALKYIFGTSRNILSWRELDVEYGFFPDIDATVNFMKAYTAVLRARVSKYVDAFARHGDVIDAPFPVDLDASRFWTMGIMKSVAVRRVLATPPVFSPKLPHAWNYGTLGLAVATLLTWYISDYSYTTGNYTFFPNASWQAFTGLRDYTDCLSRHFDLRNVQIVAKSVALSVMLREVEEADEFFISRQGSGKLTGRQLFFVTSCSLLCKTGTSDYHKELCRAPLRQSPLFAKAFSCPYGAPMNPSLKCHLDY
ncbi:unnamed protein product [Ixodes hexagonus]